MRYLIFNPRDQEKLNSDVSPLLEEAGFVPTPFDAVEGLSLTAADTFATSLDDTDLATTIAMLPPERPLLGILPHPGLKRMAAALGISVDMDLMVDAFKTPDSKIDAVNIDLLYCNGLPVFHSVSIGEMFALDDEAAHLNFFTEVLGFLRKVRKLGSLSHAGFSFSISGEEVVKTSALGVVVVAHAKGSVVARRMVPESAIDDGLLYAMVLAPQDILTMVGFMLRSLIPFQKTLVSTPSFMGLMAADNMAIDCSNEIDFVIDGLKQTSNHMDFVVRKEALKLLQISEKEEAISNEAPAKKMLKIENLPKGQKRDELIRYSLPFLPRATAEEFKDLFSTLRANARFRSSYAVMMILSTIIATFGLFADSSPVIIGAMILAPLMGPIISFSMGVVRYDVNMLKSGIKTILIGTLVSLAFAAFVSLIIPLRVVTSEIAARLSPTLLDLGIAVASGIAAAYAHSKEEIAKTLAGVAIAVALVPPLAVAGIGIGWLDWGVFSGAFLLYLTNLAGIIMFGGLTFLLLGFAPFRRARAGLVYTLIIIIAVCIPLTFSFNQIRQEARITEMLEGITINEAVLNDVKVRSGKRPTVSLRLISPTSLTGEEIKDIKVQVEAVLQQEVRLEVVNVVAL